MDLEVDRVGLHCLGKHSSLKKNYEKVEQQFVLEER